jgi:hypothetical protein
MRRDDLSWSRCRGRSGGVRAVGTRQFHNNVCWNHRLDGLRRLRRHAWRCSCGRRFRRWRGVARSGVLGRTDAVLDGGRSDFFRRRGIRRRRHVRRRVACGRGLLRRRARRRVGKRNRRRSDESDAENEPESDDMRRTRSNSMFAAGDHLVPHCEPSASRAKSRPHERRDRGCLGLGEHWPYVQPQCGSSRP